MAARHDQSIIGKIVLAPGMFMQHFSAKEPSADMIEIALASLEAVIPEDSGEDIW